MSSDTHIRQSQINSTSLFSKSPDFCTSLALRARNKNTQPSNSLQEEQGAGGFSTSEQLQTRSWQKFFQLQFFPYAPLGPGKQAPDPDPDPVPGNFVLLFSTFDDFLPNRCRYNAKCSYTVCHIHSTQCSGSLTASF